MAVPRHIQIPCPPRGDHRFSRLRAELHFPSGPGQPDSTGIGNDSRSLEPGFRCSAEPVIFLRGCIPADRLQLLGNRSAGGHVHSGTEHHRSNRYPPGVHYPGCPGYMAWRLNCGQTSRLPIWSSRWLVKSRLSSHARLGGIPAT